MKGHKSEHHKRAEGGKVQEYTPDDNVEKEAKERKKGGRVEKKDCMPERKHGGRVKDEHRVEGKMSSMRLDRPGRKSGGRVGSDKSPLSSAHTVSSVQGHHTDD